eukprot:TRINITY_DN40197_c0_g1_i1.p1 TRINITY_DN40197_c0_g1~~TRINITY_DN40197_c0_g1_i1.p1  ORF type:complete len:327 (+),score=58.49 TRINITY_DN40197_c0_g1_i1:80-1060(+)
MNPEFEPLATSADAVADESGSIGGAALRTDGGYITSRPEVRRLSRADDGEIGEAPLSLLGLRGRRYGTAFLTIGGLCALLAYAASRPQPFAADGEAKSMVLEKYETKTCVAAFDCYDDSGESADGSCEDQTAGKDLPAGEMCPMGHTCMCKAPPPQKCGLEGVCAEGHTCCNGVCCGGHSECKDKVCLIKPNCGQIYCDPEHSKCCNGMCCEKDSECVDDVCLVVPNCGAVKCPAGDKCVDNAICCAADSVVCDDKVCCGPKGICCNGMCCDGETSVCTDQGICLIKPNCGALHCTGDETCCKNELGGGICCGKGWKCSHDVCVLR